MWDQSVQGPAPPDVLLKGLCVLFPNIGVAGCEEDMYLTHSRAIGRITEYQHLFARRGLFHDLFFKERNKELDYVRQARREQRGRTNRNRQPSLTTGSVLNRLRKAGKRGRVSPRFVILVRHLLADDWQFMQRDESKTAYKKIFGDRQPRK